MSEVSLPETIAELRALVTNARAMPMSASVVVNRAELLALVDRLEAAAAGPQVAEARGEDGEVLSASEQARRIVEEAEQERDRLISQTHVFRLAQHEAADVRRRAEEDAAGLRQETDDYVDTRLAGFEVALTRTLEAVTRGRTRLHQRSHFEELAEQPDEPSDDAPAPPPGE